MTRFKKGVAFAALALAACAAANAASAQTYNRLVVFGDSLSDNGNLFAAIGQPPAPYFQGRFSSGPVFTELLGFDLARVGGPVSGSIDYAYGGSRTDASAFPPGMLAQLAAYTNAGGRFGSGDLVSVLGGANNIFQGVPAAAVSPNPTGSLAPVSRAAAADINTLVGRIASAGAGTILVTNLPRFSVLPQFRGTGAEPLVDFAVSTFNDTLITGLRTTAASQPGTNIIYMDLFKAGDAINANPGLFGITNSRDACFTGTTLCSDPSGFFYFDGVHPTATGHRLIAQLADDYLYYGDAGAVTTVQGETAFRHRETSLDAATAYLSGSVEWAAGTRLTAGASYESAETDARGTAASADSNTREINLGIETGTESLRFGVSGNARIADVDAGAQTFQLQSLGIDAYGGYRMNNVFVNAAVGVSNDDYKDIARLTSLSAIRHSGSTEGISTGARLQAGVWFDMGGVAISPRAAVSYINSDVDAYFEQGAAAQYSYADRTVAATTAEVTLRGEADVAGFAVFAEGGYRDSLSDDSDAVRVGIAGNTAQFLSRSFEQPFGGQVLASAGVSGTMGPVKVELGYKGRFGDNADSHTGGIRFSLPLQ